MLLIEVNIKIFYFNGVTNILIKETNWQLIYKNYTREMCRDEIIINFSLHFLQYLFPIILLYFNYYNCKRQGKDETLIKEHKKA